VLRAAHITGAVELTRTTRSVLHDLLVSDGAWRFATMKGRATSLLAASSRRRARRRRDRARPVRPVFVRDRRPELDELDTTFDFRVGLSLPRVHARATSRSAPRTWRRSRCNGIAAQGPAPASSPASRATFTFEVTDADLRGGGVLRVLNGRARVELPFSADGSRASPRRPAPPMPCRSIPILAYLNSISTIHRLHPNRVLLLDSASLFLPHRSRL